jgi:hypothetical protein
MGFVAKPLGAARRVPRFRTTAPGWDEAAVCLLLDLEDVIVDGVFIDAGTMGRRRSVWAQLRERLRPHGIRLPVVPPSDAAARFRGFLGATGCTGPAG